MFDSKDNFTTPTILLGPLLCPRTWSIPFGGIQYSPVGSCLAVSCNPGVLPEEECTFFYSTIFSSSDGSSKNQESYRTSTFDLLTTPKPLTMWHISSCSSAALRTPAVGRSCPAPSPNSSRREAPPSPGEEEGSRQPRVLFHLKHFHLEPID